jgi:hypothetical protein
LVAIITDRNAVVSSRNETATTAILHDVMGRLFRRPHWTREDGRG